MRMQADWDDPFSEVTIFSPVRYESRREFIQASAGLLIPRYHVDVEHVRAAQRGLLPFFRALQETADEMLQDADPTSRMVSEREVCSTTIYRRPDTPDFLQEFQFVRSDHIVILNESGVETHPLVDRLFPLRHFSQLSTEEQEALRSLTQIKLCRSSLGPMDVPEYIRVVFPGMINSIVRWIEDNEGPIHKFNYFVRPKEAGKPMRAAIDIVLH